MVWTWSRPGAQTCSLCDSEPQGFSVCLGWVCDVTGWLGYDDAAIARRLSKLSVNDRKKKKRLTVRNALTMCRSAEVRIEIECSSYSKAWQPAGADSSMRNSH